MTELKKKIINSNTLNRENKKSAFYDIYVHK